MIAKSDMIILVISAAALTVGIYRWQHNTSVVPSVTIPASSQSSQAQRSASEIRNNISNRPTVTRLPSVNVSADSQSGQASGEARVVKAPVKARPVVIDGDTASNRSGGNDPLYGSYDVKSGDYLGRIAEQFGTTVSTLQDINELDGSTIQIGQELRYPLPAN